MKHILHTFAVAVILLIGTSCQTISPAPTPVAVPAPKPLESVYRINVTSQPYSFYSPWQKKQHFSRSAVATVVGPNLLLASAAVVRDHTYIELEKIDSGVKAPAELVCVDYEADLALIRAKDNAFMAGSKPLELIEKLPQGKTVEAWQFEGNGTPLITSGESRRAAVLRYPHGRFLGYQVNIALPSFAQPQGTPAIVDGKLAGIMLNYSSNSQTMHLVSAEVIRHFMADYADGTYEGFPQAGFGFSRLDDPQLRDYVALPENEQGVYITYVRPNSPAAESGLAKGDVLLAIDSHNIDRLGQYEDPDYGKLGLMHINSTRSTAGDKRTLHVWRDKKRLALTVTLRTQSPDSFPIAPYIYDRGSDYVITGGLVFMELSRQFLKEWGPGWDKRAPQRLVHYDRHQWEMFKPGQKLVILTRILKTEANTGYGALRFKILTKLNGLAINRLEDIPKALARPAKGNVHLFEFESPTEIMVLDVDAVKKADAFVRQYVRELQSIRD